MRALELTRSGVLGTILVFVVVAVCVRLGLWQLDRREQRLERNQAVAARLAQAPVPLTGAPLDTIGLTHRRATAQGSYDDDRTLILGGRSLAGVPGVHVFTPLRTGQGALLVNRGWVPSNDAATVARGPLAVDTPVTVAGVLLPIPETGDPEDDGGRFRTTWFRLDVDAIRDQFPYPLSPLYLQIESADESAALRAARLSPGTPAPLPGPELDAGPHLSYAFQWFGFAVVFLVGWAALVLRRAEQRPGGGAIRGRGAEPESERTLP